MKRSLFVLLIFPILITVSAAQSLLDLHPRPKIAWSRADTFHFDRLTEIVIPAVPTPGTRAALAYLQRRVAALIGDTLPVVAGAPGGGPMILLGEKDALPSLRDEAARSMARGEEWPGREGYLLDVGARRVVLAGADPEGTFHAVATLAQLMVGSGTRGAIAGAHVNDAPDYPVRWVFSQHNLRGNGAISQLRSIADTMAAYKLNGLQQNDFKYAILGEQPDYYFDSVAALRGILADRAIAMIPGVAGIGYSSGILANDPNLAEGIPATATFVIQGDTGRLVPDPRVALPNGSFESVGSDGKFSGWTFYDGATNDTSVVADRQIQHGGSVSARCSNFRTGDQARYGNCRFSRRVSCEPHRAYVLSAWCRTKDLVADQVQLLAIGSNASGGSRALTYTAYAIPATSDWMKVVAVFNTLDFTTVTLYAGVWGGRSGTIWWDDIDVREAGLVNVLRRTGAPLIAENLRSRKVLLEGMDIDPIVDSTFLRGRGNVSPEHRPPRLRRLAGGAVRNGDTIVVRFHHPIATVADIDGNGSVMVCVSEDSLYRLLDDQIGRVEGLYHPGRFFLGHDEIRTMNWDSACLRRALSPAALLADNLTRCLEIVERHSPGAATYVWSDMFDSLHNAVDDYYLVNGDLRGVWDMIPRTPTIVNWNYGQRAASLARFSRLGFRQVTSPYYDARSTTGMRDWRLAMEGVPGVDGMMYTTWAGDFSFLRPFAFYAWGAGPYLLHAPLGADVLTLVAAGSPVPVEATVLPDPYDAGAGIEKVQMDIYSPASSGTARTVSLSAAGGNRYAGAIDGLAASGFRYRLVAVDRRGLRRETPLYLVGGAGAGVGTSDPEPAGALTISMAPQPLRGEGWLRFHLPRAERWELRVIDPAGRVVISRRGEGSGEEMRIDGSGLASGLYRCELRAGASRGACALAIVR